MFAVVGIDIHPRLPSGDISIYTDTKNVSKITNNTKGSMHYKKSKKSTLRYIVTGIVLGSPSQQRGEVGIGLDPPKSSNGQYG